MTSNNSMQRYKKITEIRKKLKNGQVIPSHFGKRLFNHRIEKCYLIGNDVWAKVQNISCKKLNK